jgi:uncharacterized protein
MNNLFNVIFKVRKPVIAMIHVMHGSRPWQVTMAMNDLEILNPLVDAVLVENYGSEAYHLMPVLECVQDIATIPVGVNVLPNDYQDAFAQCQFYGGSFIQLDHVTGKFVNSESIDEADYLMSRANYSNIAVLGGVHPKYYQMKQPIPPIGESAKIAKKIADAVVVTGNATGDAASLADLQAVRDAVGDFPIIIGSGLTPKNAKEQLSIADGAIVGTSLKKRGVVSGEPVDQEMTKRLMEVVHTFR